MWRSYLQWISGYIYDEPQKRTLLSRHILYSNTADPSFLLPWNGLWLSLHACRFMGLPSDRLLITGKRTRQPGNYLPYIPLSVSTMSFPWNHRTDRIPDGLGVSTIRGKTDQFDPDTDLIRTPPPAYHLFGTDVDLECPVRCGHITVPYCADNILNKE